ncbi:CPBP family intramembrane glutamic endopeptidase [Methanobrevibacter sp.]|uniref:CPBP family intramembrane glutamic endopeptidase n=1 Tax=Methanobrevibacter sp. TaxID=66852 RepID=UPI0026E09D4A|nr:CPBP family intramembrane glutamic endopeptidase [Methanobrevibacter sp.]MDO5823397.1 CPBP family intramembrane metalloprotease [Methanobrevibacter sp.]
MNSNKKIFSKIGFNYLIYTILSIIITIIVANIIVIIKPEILNDINIATIITAICNYILPFPILVYLMRKIESKPIEIHKLDIKTFLKYLCITFTLMWFGNVTGIIITSLLGGALQSEISNPIQNLISSTGIWLNILIISLIGPIFEEIIFRKLLIDRTNRYGAKVSIILSAVTFGLIHGNLNQFCYAFLIGGFFAYVYLKTGKIIYTIVLHIIINLMGSVVSIFVSDTVQTIAAGAIDPFNIVAMLIYLMVIVIALYIGITSLLKYKQERFNGKLTEISLKNPLGTMFLNYGMVCFIVFFIVKIAYQAIT